MSRLDGFAFQYALFSKSGFTKALRERSDPDLLLFRGSACTLLEPAK